MEPLGTTITYGLPFANVVANGIATTTISIGKTIETVRLVLGGTSFNKSMVEMIRFKVNGRIIIEATGLQLDAINQYRGATPDARFIDIDFALLEMWDDFGRIASALDTTFGIANITIEVSIGAATAPTLKAILIQSQTQKNSKEAFQPWAKFMRRIARLPVSRQNGGELQVSIPFGPNTGGTIMRLFYFGAGEVSAMRIKADGIVVHESTLIENDYYNKRNGNFPQANTYVVDFVSEHDIRTALVTKGLTSLEILMTTTTASSGYMLVEYISTLEEV